jgi:predicted NAD/FAD-dependent oxidoreductase
MADTTTLGVIGAGVAGCALAASLRRRGWRGPIGLWEAGRGPGGRAASRRSRHDDALVIDHGAPLFNIACTPAPALLAPLRAGGWIEPWAGIAADLESPDQLRRPSRDPLLAGELWHGCGGMDRIGHGLLELAEAWGPVERHWGHRVRQLERRPGGGWGLYNDDGEELAAVDWLVVSGSLLAHPRATTLLGWPEVPLERLAAEGADPRLAEAVAAIGATGSQGRSNLLLLLPAALAQPWRQLPFQLLACDREAEARWGLRRLSVQPLTDGRCALVAHSSATLAAQHQGVYGTGSAIARELGARPDPAAEDALMETMVQAVGGLVAPWLGEAAAAGLAAADRQLMRWGAAFPLAPGLPAELQLCPASRIGFCGDFVAGPGFGRVEGALRSAEGLARHLSEALKRHGAAD